MFEKQRINLETLSEYLQTCRNNLNISIEEVSKKSSIKLSYLKALEAGEFNKLPPDVYILGFLKILAQIYNIDYLNLSEQFKKEKNIELQLKKTSQKPAALTPKGLKIMVITPKMLSLLAGLLFTVVTLGYIIYQVYAINRQPNLIITKPQQQQIIKDTFVNVEGHTDPGMSITVNDEDIFVDNNGNFKTQLGITPGPRDVKIVAKNKFGKTTTNTISVVAQSSTPNNTADKNLGLVLKLNFKSDVKLSYNLDDTPAQNFYLHSGDEKILVASKKILLSTSNAGATEAVLNGQMFGTLGRENEQLTNVQFLAKDDNSPQLEATTTLSQILQNTSSVSSVGIKTIKHSSTTEEQ